MRVLDRARAMLRSNSSSAGMETSGRESVGPQQAVDSRGSLSSSSLAAGVGAGVSASVPSRVDTLGETVAWLGLRLDRNTLDTQVVTRYLLSPPVPAPGQLMQAVTMAEALPRVVELEGLLDGPVSGSGFQGDRASQAAISKVHSQIDLEITISRRSGSASAAQLP